MSWWPITVYSVAALFGLRTLFALMVQHRRRHLNELKDAEMTRRAAEAAPPDEPAKDESPSRRAA